MGRPAVAVLFLGTVLLVDGEGVLRGWWSLLSDLGTPGPVMDWLEPLIARLVLGSLVAFGKQLAARTFGGYMAWLGSAWRRVRSRRSSFCRFP